MVKAMDLSNIYLKDSGVSLSMLSYREAPFLDIATHFTHTPDGRSPEREASQYYNNESDTCKSLTRRFE